MKEVNSKSHKQAERIIGIIQSLHTPTTPHRSPLQTVLFAIIIFVQKALPATYNYCISQKQK